MSKLTNHSHTMTFIEALDELDALNDLRDWCDAYIARQELEELAIALSSDLSD
jgi:hypothetical protein